MHDDAYKAMQAVVDIVNESPHPTHKIASGVFNEDFLVTATNDWPKEIADKIGTESRIGYSSGTIHAETNAILKAPKTDKANICITDPFCPNCAKNIVEAGIKAIYIDHKGFEKEFWKKSGDHFENMSMEIVAKAGISVYKIHRKEKKIDVIFEPQEGYTPPEDSPIHIEPCPESKEAFTTLVHDMMQQYHNRKFVTAMVKTQEGSTFCMTARVHAVTGYSIKNDRDIEIITNPGQKYSYLQEPLNRFIMAAKRKGYEPHPEYVFCSQIPTSREQVNLVGAGIKKIMVSDPFRARRDEDKEAKRLLESHNIITFEEFLL